MTNRVGAEPLLHPEGMGTTCFGPHVPLGGPAGIQAIVANSSAKHAQQL
jgi:hypothetical protein